MFLKFLPTGACLIFWHRTEQQVYSLMLRGHSFHRFSFNKYFWAFVICQAFFTEQAVVVNKTGETPVVGTYHVEILHIPEHSLLGSLNLVCHRLNITCFPVVSSVVFGHSGQLLLFSRGNWVPSTTELIPSVSCPRCRGVLAFDVDAALPAQPKVDLALFPAAWFYWLLLRPWLTTTPGSFSDELLTILHL